MSLAQYVGTSGEIPTYWASVPPPPGLEDMGHMREVALPRPAACPFLQAGVTLGNWPSLVEALTPSIILQVHDYTSLDRNYEKPSPGRPESWADLGSWGVGG